jgi:hypothetical protein
LACRAAAKIKAKGGVSSSAFREAAMDVYAWSGQSPWKPEYFVKAIGQKLQALYDIEELQRPTDRFAAILRQIDENEQRRSPGKS